MKKYLTQSPNQTKKLGERLANKILTAGSQKTARIFGLEGDLGSGKTTFLQGLAGGLGIREKILSPTFVILKRFKISGFRFKNFYHIDCYRINNPKEILDLGFKEIVKNPQNIVAIEWANAIKKIVPETADWIKFKIVNKNIRKIMIK